MEQTAEVEQLWQEFHSVVNMTSRELRDWLRTQSASENAEELPDKSGTETGQDVLHILGKRRTDLTDHDLEVMRRVIDMHQTEQSPEAAQSDSRRHRLMTIGHDPLKVK